jgi:hypothetical protein
MKREQIIIGTVAIILIITIAMLIYENGISLPEQNINLTPTSTTLNSSSSEISDFTYFFVQKNITKPSNDYLKYKINITNFCLVDSNLSYVISNKDYTDTRANIVVKKGELFVIINGTIRNDYDRGYYFWLTANIFNNTGDNIGDLSINPEKTGFNECYLFYQNNSIRSFEIRVKYNKTDISSYNLIIASNPTEMMRP